MDEELRSHLFWSHLFWITVPFVAAGAGWCWINSSWFTSENIRLLVGSIITIVLSSAVWFFLYITFVEDYVQGGGL